MSETGMRTYVLEDGSRKSFDHQLFRRLFDERSKAMGGKRNVGDLTKQLETAVRIGPDAIKAWRYGRNAPADLDMVGRIAGFFEVERDTLLIGEKEDEMARLTERQLEAVTRVYKEIEDYVYLINHIDFRMNGKQYRVKDGSRYARYATSWMDYTGDIDDYLFDNPIDLADKGQEWVIHALEREWIDLGNHPLYGELAECIDESLWRLWDAKHDMEMYEKGEGLMTAELAIKQVRDIIGRYL